MRNGVIYNRFGCYLSYTTSRFQSSKMFSRTFRKQLSILCDDVIKDNSRRNIFQSANADCDHQKAMFFFLNTLQNSYFSVSLKITKTTKSPKQE